MQRVVLLAQTVGPKNVVYSTKWLNNFLPSRNSNHNLFYLTKLRLPKVNFNRGATEKWKRNNIITRRAGDSTYPNGIDFQIAFLLHNACRQKQSIFRAW